MNRWTVHVTDFGKVEEADVQVAAIDALSGDNNSRKKLYDDIDIRSAECQVLF